MDCRTGEIIQNENMQELFEKLSRAERRHYKKMALAPTEKQLKRNPPKVGRNEPCPCGSGKKFKKCCLE